MWEDMWCVSVCVCVCVYVCVCECMCVCVCMSEKELWYLFGRGHSRLIPRPHPHLGPLCEVGHQLLEGIKTGCQLLQHLVPGPAPLPCSCSKRACAESVRSTNSSCSSRLSATCEWEEAGLSGKLVRLARPLLHPVSGTMRHIIHVGGVVCTPVFH